MKLSEVLPALEVRLRLHPLFESMEIVLGGGSDYNARVEGALRERGLVVVCAMISASPTDPKAPLLRLRGEFMLSVLENPATNSEGPRALVVAEELLACLHQHRWSAQRGRMNEIMAGSPAIEAGPLDSGLVTYFCHVEALCDQPPG